MTTIRKGGTVIPMLLLTRYVEHDIAGTWVEYAYEVEISDWEPATVATRWSPGHYGHVEIDEGPIWRKRTDGKGGREQVPFSVFLEGLAEGYLDDPPTLPYARSAMDKALEDLQSEAFEECIENALEAEYAAADARYDEMKDEGW